MNNNKNLLTTINHNKTHNERNKYDDDINRLNFVNTLSTILIPE